MSSIERPFLRRHALEGDERRPRSVGRLVTAAALSAALLVGTVGPASAAVRQPARTAPISLDSGVVIEVAHADSATTQDTTITILPGVVLSITSIGIELSLSAQVVSDLQTGDVSGQDIAETLGEFLDDVPFVSAVAAVVGWALVIGSSLLADCTAKDGSAAFAITWSGIPSCTAP